MTKKVIDFGEVNVNSVKTKSGGTAYRVTIYLTDAMPWIGYPDSFKVQIVEDDGEYQIVLIPQKKSGPKKEE